MSKKTSQDQWFSMEGYLFIKFLSSPLAFLTSRKRLYFGLDEHEDCLVYYKDKTDFDKRKDCVGTIPLGGAICIPSPGPRQFVLQRPNIVPVMQLGLTDRFRVENKKYEIEADTVRCAECWLNALQRRRDLNDNAKLELPMIVFNTIRRSRSRSKSVNSLDDSDHATPMYRPKQPPTRRKVVKPDETPAEPLNPIEARLSRCISIHNPRRKASQSNAQAEEANFRPGRKMSLQLSELGGKAEAAEAEKKPPFWLEEWVSQWLHQSLEQAPPRSRHSLASSGTSAGGGAAPLASSTATTSPVRQAKPGGGSSSEFGLETDRSSVHSAASFPDVYDELLMLREVDNQQKARIHSLTMQLEKLRMRQNSTDNSKVMDDTALIEQNRLLNSELVRLNEKLTLMDKEVTAWKRRVEELDNDMENFKKEYVYLLQSSVRIPLHEHSTCDAVQVKLFGGAVHENRVKRLLVEARQDDPKLPTFESITTTGSYHVDDYGFRHAFEEVPLALHYICTQLNAHYYAQSDDYARLKAKWRALLDENPQRIENTKANRQLCRAGIPRSMRSSVWRVLINQQVADLKAKYGEYYYRNLCSNQGSPAEKMYCTTHQKQINLDLLRTMPSNVHFMSASCKGVNHLQAVLRAFCLHSPVLGYCQGMNFLAAVALLFVSPEDAFWFLIAITERHFDRAYFDQNLSGAQADQEVLKELVELKFPRLARHLDDCDIDLTTVTLNWFLALFFDAVPFQTMLRIWDCFLLEGSKVLFRFAVALLGQYQDEILDRSDTIAVMKVLKAAVRLTYDVDGLIKCAFEDMQPFPSRTTLNNKHQGYLEILQVRLNQRMVLRNYLNVAIIHQETSEKVCDLPVEAIVFSQFERGTGYVLAGNEKRGKLAMIRLEANVALMRTLDLEFDCRPVSMVILKQDMAFISLLSGYIVALRLEKESAQILWELKLNDVALKLLYHDERLYAALANGTLTVLENAFVSRPTCLDLYHIPIAAAPITDAVMDEECLYLAVACKVMLLNKDTLSIIGSVYVASSACGSHVPMFEKIRAFSDSPYGLWLTTAHSSLVQLWLESECQILFDITYDHSQSSRRPSFDEADQQDPVEIYSIMYHEEELWVGTVDGYLMLYGVSRVEVPWERTGSATSKQKTSWAERPYPAGKRLSPAQNHYNNTAAATNSTTTTTTTTTNNNNNNVEGSCQSGESGAEPALPGRQTMYYIPTDHEKMLEELASAKEYPQEARNCRKISVIINQDTKQYKVNVEDVRQMSADSPIDTSSNLSPRSAISSTNSQQETNERASQKGRGKLTKGISIDSAVSLRSLDGKRQSYCDVIPELEPAQPEPAKDENLSIDSPPKPKPKESSLRKRRQPNLENLENLNFVSAGEGSMEYDDTFNLYSDSDGCAKDIGLLEESLAQASPSLLKSVQIPVRKMSAHVFGKFRPLTVAESACETDACSTSTCASASASATTPTSRGGSEPAEPRALGRTKSLMTRQRPKLRRRDLDIRENATCLVAVRESADSDHNPHRTLSDMGGAASPPEPPYASRKCSALLENGVDGLAPRPVRQSIRMQLQMKLKVADKPVKCITVTKTGDEPIVITGSGNYGDEEAILRWRRDSASGLWINDPLVDTVMSCRRRATIKSRK